MYRLMAPPHLIYIYIFHMGLGGVDVLRLRGKVIPTVRVGGVSNMIILITIYHIHSNNRCMMWVCDGIKPYTVGINFDPVVFLWLWSDTLCFCSMFVSNYIIGCM